MNNHEIKTYQWIDIQSNGYPNCYQSETALTNTSQKINIAQLEIILNKMNTEQVLIHNIYGMPPDENGTNIGFHKKTDKYDKSTHQWIPDDDAITENKRKLLISQAQQALAETAHYETQSYQATCTDTENEANIAYRIDLHKIMRGMYNGTKLPIDPNLKE